MRMMLVANLGNLPVHLVRVTHLLRRFLPSDRIADGDDIHVCGDDVFFVDGFLGEGRPELYLENVL